MSNHTIADIILDHAYVTADRITSEINRVTNTISHTQVTNDALIENVKGSFDNLIQFISDSNNENAKILHTHRRELEKLRAEILKGSVQPPDEPVLNDTDVDAIASTARLDEIALEPRGGTDRDTADTTNTE